MTSIRRRESNPVCAIQLERRPVVDYRRSIAVMDKQSIFGNTRIGRRTQNKRHPNTRRLQRRAYLRRGLVVVFYFEEAVSRPAATASVHAIFALVGLFEKNGGY